MRSPAVFEAYERNSPLSALNPTVKLAVSLGLMLVATAVFDLQSLIGIFALGLLVALLIGRVPIPVILRGLIPFLLFGIGYFWMNAVLPRDSGTVALEIGPLSVVHEGMWNGLRFAVRALCFGIYSILFVATTDPVSFTRSLHQNLGVPPRFAYSALAAYRYLPALRDELHQIRSAHRLRGLGEGDGLRGKIVQFYRYTIPLLAASLRRAGRVADSMEVRGLGRESRSIYRRVPVRAIDWWYAAAMFAAVALLLWFGVHAGSIELWGGALWS
ncbi:MAG: energy-coupling factor transporter transmembrane component T family protein [bacterium]